MYVVVGLGNPGAKYEDTRHNVGFLVVDLLARRSATRIDRAQHGALTGKAQVAGQPIVLAKPQSFMNLSGGPTQRLSSFYQAPLERVVVVHDEVDLPFGDVRVKRGGGHGGHNGIRDIVKHAGAECIRIRVGVSRPPEGWDTAKYVLGRWAPEERAELEDVLARAADAVECVVTSGAQQAMNQFNVRTRGERASSQGESS